MMKNKRSIVLLIFAVILIGLPLLADRWLAAKSARYDELIRLAECYPDSPCAADFNGNGTLDRLALVQKNPDDRFDWWLTIVDDEDELFAIPYTGIDGSFRTHAAIHKPAQEVIAHLLIYDGGKMPHIRSTYAWDGKRMREIEASPLERDIISAMASRDDTGTFHQWIIWEMASTYLLPVYCLIVGVGLVLLSRSKLGKR
jgi:hypothetical protein